MTQLTEERQREVLLSEMQHLAETIHRRACEHVTQWRVSDDPRSVLSQIGNMVAGLLEDIGRLKGAISWLEPPFVDERTPCEELRRRVGFMLRFAAQVDRSPEGQDRNGLDAKHESAVAKPCAQNDTSKTNPGG